MPLPRVGVRAARPPADPHAYQDPPYIAEQVASYGRDAARHQRFATERVQPYAAALIGNLETVGQSAQAGYAQMMAQVAPALAQAAGAAGAPQAMGALGPLASPFSYAGAAAGENAITRGNAAVGDAAYQAAAASLSQTAGSQQLVGGIAQQIAAIPNQYAERRDEFLRSLVPVRMEIEETRRRDASARSDQRERDSEDRRRWALGFAEDRRRTDRGFAQDERAFAEDRRRTDRGFAQDERAFAEDRRRTDRGFAQDERAFAENRRRYGVERSDRRAETALQAEIAFAELQAEAMGEQPQFYDPRSIPRGFVQLPDGRIQRDPGFRAPGARGGAGSGRTSVAQLRQATARARAMAQGIPQRALVNDPLDPGARPGTQPTQSEQVTGYAVYDVGEIVRELVASGLSRAEARRIAYSVDASLGAPSSAPASRFSGAPGPGGWGG